MSIKKIVCSVCKGSGSKVDNVHGVACNVFCNRCGGTGYIKVMVQDTWMSLDEDEKRK